jgi:alanyl-tRNA synthetase
LVRIGDVELAACGGTHLRSTAEMLPLLALSRQRIRGGLTRVTFRAGLEAGERASRTVALADALARGFSARWDELPERVEALRDEVAALRREAERARADWASLRVASVLAQGRRVGGRPVLRIVTDDAERLAALADAAKDGAPAAIALLAARGGERATLLFQAGPDVEVDLRPALRAALPAVGGRGGGKPDRVQGAGPESEGVEAALDAAEAVLEGIDA